MSDHQSKVCPILSLIKTKSSILAGVQAEPEAEVSACIGPACMFFIPFQTEQGPSGHCAIALIPTAIAQLNRK